MQSLAAEDKGLPRRTRQRPWQAAAAEHHRVGSAGAAVRRSRACCCCPAGTSVSARRAGLPRIAARCAIP